MKEIELSPQFKQLLELNNSYTCHVPEDFVFPNRLEYVYPDDLIAEYNGSRVVKLISAYPDDEPYIEVSFTSWRGYSIGAQHFYGKIKCYSNWITVTEDGETNSVMGYTPHIPDAIRDVPGISLEVTRPLEEKDFALTARYRENPRLYKIGDPTDGWFDLKPLVDKTRQFCDVHFKDWKVEIDNSTGLEIFF